ncbi:MAG: aminoglycoside/choline kinase family phosphotransferase [Rickettsiales bacterium]|jgi:aminoglycoside/choline kinase family phosphotransferase
MNRESAKKEFLDNYLGLSSYKISPIPGDCSPRSYDRVSGDNKNFILMDAPIDIIDIEPFIVIDSILRNNNFSAPEIHKVDKKNGFLLSEDFGNNSFNHILSNLNGKNLNLKEEEIYQCTTDLLIELHKINLSCVDLPEYNNKLLLKELAVFIDYYLKFIEHRNLSKKERQEFEEVWLELFQKLSNDKFLVLRDYHADNLFFLEKRCSYKKIGLIDFQDAVLGSRAYDLMSLLQDARRDVSKNLEQNMINHYIKSANIDSASFITDYKILSLQRNIKILGVFAKQGFLYRNKRYLDLIPRVLEYVLRNLEEKNFNNLKLLLKW